MKRIFFISGMRAVYIILLLGLMCIGNAYSQEKSIQILNTETKAPVKDVFYKYDKKTGVSDENGNIKITYKENLLLLLSHVQFGKSEVSSSVLLESVKTGILKVAFTPLQLLPVTIIQVHPGAGEKTDFEVTFQDKLEHDAGSLLDQFSSVSTIKKSGAYGFDPVLRGFKYDQLNLVIDGVQTASAACPNRMDPAASQIPINMISKVEVMKGPYSLRYGNAFGGTINFKSSVPQFNEKAKFNGRLGTSYESNGNILRTEGVAGVSGKKVDLNIFGSYSQGEDYKDGEGVIIPAQFNRLNWGSKLGFKWSERQNMGFLFSNNRAKNVDFPSLPMDLRDDDTWLFNVGHSFLFYDKMLHSWKTTVYFTRVNHEMDNLSKMLNPRTVNAFTNASTLNYGGRTEIRFNFKSSYLFSGIDYRFESADGERIRNILMGPMAGKTMYDNVWQDAQIQRGGVFAEFHFNRPALHAVISGRLDYNASQSNNPDPNFEALYPEMNSKYINPSLSVGGTKMLNKSISLGLWVGTAQRSPGIAERYINFFPIGLDPYEMIGNPQLKPEINNQVDAIFEYKSSKTNIVLDLYSSFLRNYISSEIVPEIKPKMATSPGVRRFINIDKALISGFELDWKQAITSFLKHDFSLVYTHGTDKKLDEPLPEIPPLEIKYRLAGNFLRNRLVPEILIRQVFKQNRIAASYGETETPGFNVVDVKISWLAGKSITASGGVSNLFDSAYYEHLSRSVRGLEARPIYSPGRSFFVTLTFNFM